ncbi:MAG: radical SAM protein [Prevotellaceae bacterium]|jgi:wyosine [tRNA(Phe)-imidazoG37] synthetase (radical SAM superfamily)|nr:radical SAM protein [Prevotellaceae bacterium]
MILFENIVFGPVKSRRLGTSLGINLLPLHGKWCNFDCIYCECGWNKDGRNDKQLHPRSAVRAALEARLQQLASTDELPDAITFSGNGEPTLHPEFSGIVGDVIALRDLYAPKAKVCLLSNATNIGKKEVFQALRRIDRPILKLDSGFAETVKLMNCPQNDYSIKNVVAALQAFKGEFILQTMFLRGEHEGVKIDNTTPAELDKWLHIVAQLRPKEVMIYTIDRATPAKNLQKVPLEELETIADKVRAMGILVRTAG